MRFLVIISAFILLSSCTDHSDEKVVVTDSVPTGYIDSLTNDDIENLEEPTKKE